MRYVPGVPGAGVYGEETDEGFVLLGNAPWAPPPAAPALAPALLCAASPPPPRQARVRGARAVGGSAREPSA